MTPERPLRLCILAPVMRRHRGYFTPHSGLVAKVLADLGHEVVVLTADLPEGGGLVETENGFEVHYLAGTPVSKGGEPFWRDTAAAFDRLHAERPFDIVFGRGLAVWGFLKHSRFADTVPVILHEGTYPRWLHQIETRLGAFAPLLTYPLAPIFALKNRRTQHCLQSATRVICNNPALAAAYRRASWWHPPKALSLIYGFETARYHPRPPAMDQTPRLVFLGRLAKDKGVLAMIDVLARLKQRSAVLEALGPASPKMRKLVLDHARRRGVADRYSAPGAVQHEDVPDRLAGASVFLFPSTHAEGLPKAVLEAMACGLPVVAYRQRVLEGVVEDGVTGFLVPIRSVDAMVERVDQLLGDPARAIEMGAAARRKIETDFTPQAINAQWQALLAEVVAEAAVQRGG
jgi:glycosyltransferase involved in cell wall biosynthesis